jgi:hypothetical protein
MPDIEPSYDYTERQRAREKAIHWENRACEAEAEVKRLRGALEFYADPTHWLADGAIQTPGMHPLMESPVAFDAGERARGALDA